MNLTGHFVNHTSIAMTWIRVPKEYRHGIIEGYRLHYKDSIIPDAPWQNVTVENRHSGSDIFNTTVTGLRIYTPYMFRIQAYTIGGEGVLSDNVTIWTDEYGKLIAVKFYLFFYLMNP